MCHPLIPVVELSFQANWFLPKVSKWNRSGPTFCFAKCRTMRMKRPLVHSCMVHVLVSHKKKSLEHSVIMNRAYESRPRVIRNTHSVSSMYFHCVIFHTKQETRVCRDRNLSHQTPCRYKMGWEGMSYVVVLSGKVSHFSHAHTVCPKAVIHFLFFTFRLGSHSVRPEASGIWQLKLCSFLKA